MYLGHFLAGLIYFQNKMSQVRVLQCFQCNMFQVDLVKKSTKWQCRVCNTKQTVRKEYFRGSGAECRAHVQELNMAKGKENSMLIQNTVGHLEELQYKCPLQKDGGREGELSMETKYQHVSTQEYSSTGGKNKIKNSNEEINFTSPRRKISKWNDFL